MIIDGCGVFLYDECYEMDECFLGSDDVFKVFLMKFDGVDIQLVLYDCFWMNSCKII